MHRAFYGRSRESTAKELPLVPVAKRRHGVLTHPSPLRYTAARCELGGKESSPEECTLPTGVAPSGTTLQGSLSAAFSLLQIILEDQ